MIFYVLIGFLSAFGLLCALWILLGNWLTGMNLEVVVVQTPGRAEAAARRLLWLRNMGLVGAHLTVVSCENAEIHRSLSGKYPGVDFLTLEQYLEQERKKLDGI